MRRGPCLSGQARSAENGAEAPGRYRRALFSKRSPRSSCGLPERAREPLAGLAGSAGRFAAVVTAPDFFERKRARSRAKPGDDPGLVEPCRIAMGLDQIAARELQRGSGGVEIGF